jgi:DNA modification methylase
MIQIDKEFRDLLPPLTDDERNTLEQSLLNEGCRDALVLWNNVLVDGHNRYAICSKHNIQFETIIRDFEDRQAVITWIIDNQMSRRNLNSFQRAELALIYEDAIAQQAKERQRVAGELYGTSHPKELVQNSAQPPKDKTQDTLGKMANVSHDTISRVKKIKAKADDDTKARLRSGQVSINQVYQKIQQEEKYQAKKKKIQEALSIPSNYEPDDAITIIQSDAITFLKGQDDNSYDLIVIDPPYYGVVDDAWDNQWDTLDEYMDWCKVWMVEALRILQPHGSFYMWGSIGEHGDAIIRQKLLLDSLGYHFKDWVTWKKKRGMGNRRGWLYTREECLWYVKDNNQFFWNEEYQYNEQPNEFKVGMSGHPVKSEYKRHTNVWDDIPESLGNKGTLHYTPKPIEAIKRIILASTLEGHHVLDFFGGSGTTAVASKLTDRRCTIVDTDSLAITETQRRLQDHA